MDPRLQRWRAGADAMSEITAQPIWDDTPLPRFPKIDRHYSVDVAIIGGGLTGITAALLLKRAGCRVALLERRHLGGVDSGCTTAHLTAVIDTDLRSLVSTLGRDHAQAVWDAGFAAIDQIDTLAAELDIACDFSWVPGFRHAAPELEGDALARTVDELRAEATLARELGFDVEAVPSTPLVERAGWRIENQALFHPRKYLRGLLEHVPGDGSVVFEECDVSFTDDPEILACGEHTVRAPYVFVATHNPLAGRQGAAEAAILQTHLALYTSYALAARVPKPLDTALAAYWDTAEPYHYIRVDRDAEGVRLIVGGEDHKTGQEEDTRARFAALESWLTRLVPMASITHRWSGQVIETPDGLPFIGEAAHRQYIATGFAGNGMTFGTLSAMIVRDAITDALPNPWRELFDVNRAAIARGPLDYLRENADYPYYLVRDRFAGASTRHLRAVPRGEGRLVEVAGAIVAASRDQRGKLTLLSPTCTHLGCRVNWNQAEGTWDCPCHGSRFTPTGEVLAGPAEKALEHLAGATAKKAHAGSRT
jgi:glycine/D-amino acid oxidase-like deaminating enzyme/nitrite reductase/ring-hydroxylating ferredoxin subunit